MLKMDGKSIMLFAMDENLDRLTLHVFNTLIYIERESERERERNDIFTTNPKWQVVTSCYC